MRLYVCCTKPIQAIARPRSLWGGAICMGLVNLRSSGAWEELWSAPRKVLRAIGTLSFKGLRQQYLVRIRSHV